MGNQSAAWLAHEADAWFHRNKDKERKSDPVIETILTAQIYPKNVLEIGCGDGHHLAAIHDGFGSNCWGVDLSTSALARARADIPTFWREAKNLRGVPVEMDMVIYGFCLYACDPEDLFKIVAEGDRVLADGGHIVIHDFLPDFPHSRAYSHAPELRTYKMDFAKLWLAHPFYTMFYAKAFPHEAGEEIDGDTRTTVTILRKNISQAFPLKD